MKTSLSYMSLTWGFYFIACPGDSSARHRLCWLVLIMESASFTEMRARGRAAASRVWTRPNLRTWDGWQM